MSLSQSVELKTTAPQHDLIFLSGYDLQIQIILQIMKCDLGIKKTNQFKCDCDFDLQYCDLFQGLFLGILVSSLIGFDSVAGILESTIRYHERRLG